MSNKHNINCVAKCPLDCPTLSCSKLLEKQAEIRKLKKSLQLAIDTLNVISNCNLSLYESD